MILILGFSVQSRDRLALLPDGSLRHYIQNPEDDEADAFSIDDMDKTRETMMLHDYAQGQYCMDKVNCFEIVLMRSIISKTCSKYK